MYIKTNIPELIKTYTHIHQEIHYSLFTDKIYLFIQMHKKYTTRTHTCTQTIALAMHALHLYMGKTHTQRPLSK